VLFTSSEFLFFFLVVFSGYWLLPAGRLRVGLLLAASYYFYMSWNGRLAMVVAASSLADFLFALWIERSTSVKCRKTLLLLSITMNLGVLVYFKYANFFLETLHQMLAGIGIHRPLHALDVILPIGISFYTFEAISYTMDVYRKRVAAEKNPFHFLLFITFFPRMVAGPIIRARNFLPQLRMKRRFSWARFDLGMQYVLMGLFKKLAISDRMAQLADPVFQAPAIHSTSAIWIALIAYSLEIYCDFSGYSDIALGTAHMLGFKLPMNFDMPYVAKNIAEFWRRWHISLSTWLRDYVFIQLGGSRGTLARTVFTLLATFALCGLWHGAKWTFVVWGTGQGLMMAGHRFFREFCKTRPGIGTFLQTGPGGFLCIAATYFSVCMGWVLFRSPDFKTAAEVFHGSFTLRHGMVPENPSNAASLASAFAVVAICHVAVETGLWKKIALRLPAPVWGISYAVLLIATCRIMPSVQKAFIYFQF